MKTKTTIYLGDEDRANIALLKEIYGEKRDSEVIRRALREVATRPRPKPTKENLPGLLP